jgi:hypothetical protein
LKMALKNKCNSVAVSLDRQSFEFGVGNADCGMRIVDFKNTKFLDRYINIWHKVRFCKLDLASSH